MVEVFAIKIKDGRWFCGWFYYEWKQGRIAMFSENAPKCYDKDQSVEFERDFELLKKRKHSPTKYALDGGTGAARVVDSIPEVLSAGQVGSRRRQ